MRSTGLLVLFAATRLMAQSLCEAPPEIKAAIQQSPRGSQALLSQYPDNLWIHRTVQDSQRDGMVFKTDAIDTYKSLAEQKKTAEYLYLYGRVLVGTRTPNAIVQFNAALAMDPQYLPAHLSLVEVYRSTAFRDQAKATEHLKLWMAGCPAGLEGFHYLERSDDAPFVKEQAARLRKLLSSQNDAAGVSHYPVLWTLEFQSASPTEYAGLRQKIGADTARLRKIDGTHNYSVLRTGYKLAEDNEGTEWVNRQSPAKEAAHTSGAFQAYQDWQKAHPYPVSKPGVPFSNEVFQTRNRELVDATAGWVKQWPDDQSAWIQRLSAMTIARDQVSDAEVEDAARGLLRTGKNSSSQLQVVSVYLARNMHLNELAGMVKEILLETPSQRKVSDLFPSQAAIGPSRANAYNTLYDVYSRTGKGDEAASALKDFRRALDDEKPADSAPDFVKRQWSSTEASYWRKMAQLAGKDGRKMDQLAYYGNEIRNASFPGMAQYPTSQAKIVWKDLGGSEEGWTAWLGGLEAKKSITAVTVENFASGWTPMNRALPAFNLADMTGKTWHLADLQGKTTLINVWATWCGPCREELPLLQKLYEKLKDRADIRIITLNTDDNPGDIEPFLKQNKYTFPVLPARAYVDLLVPSLSIPRNWIVDKTATMTQESIGFGNGSGDWLEKMTKTLDKNIQ